MSMTEIVKKAAVKNNIRYIDISANERKQLRIYRLAVASTFAVIFGVWFLPVIIIKMTSNQKTEALFQIALYAIPIVVSWFVAKFTYRD